MITTWRFPIILGLSVILGMPALHDMLMASGDLVSAGSGYLAALGLSWVGVNGLFRLLEHYARHNKAASDAIIADELQAELLEIREREMAEEARRSEGVGPVTTLTSGAATPDPTRAATGDNLAGQDLTAAAA